MSVKYTIELEENTLRELANVLDKPYGSVTRSENAVQQAVKDLIHQAYNERDEQSKELTEEQYAEIEEWLTEQIKDLTHESMSYKVSPVSYDDYFDERTVLTKFKEYCEDSTGLSSFEGYLLDYYSDSFIDSDAYLYNQVYDKVRDKGLDFEILYEMFCEECGSETEAFMNCGYNGIDVNVEEYLDHNYRINLMFATDNERNYDMGAIPDYFINEGRLTYDNPEDDKRWDNALTYLIKQQGYSVDTVKSAYENLVKEMEDKNYDEYDAVLQKIDDSFVRSVVDELYNFPSYCSAELTALVTLKGRDLIDVFDKIQQGKGNIELSTNTCFGIYEEWNGAGSQFDIQLKKPVVFPASMIRNVQMEKAGRDVNRGWTVGYTYDLVGSCWKGECSVKNDGDKQKNIERE